MEEPLGNRAICDVAEGHSSVMLGAQVEMWRLLAVSPPGSCSVQPGPRSVQPGPRSTGLGAWGSETHGRCESRLSVITPVSVCLTSRMCTVAMTHKHLFFIVSATEEAQEKASSETYDPLKSG